MTRKARTMIETAETVGMPGPFEITKQLPLHDHCGYKIAVITLLRSRYPGKHSSQYTQFDTIRSYRTVYGNFVRAAPQNNGEILSLNDFGGNYHRLVSDEAGSLFFRRFIAGMKARMGQLTKPNMALSTVLMTRVLEVVEEKILVAENDVEAHPWIVFLTYAAISYVISLRGPEGFLLDLKGLNQQWNKSDDYVIIALLGRLKGERNDLAHYIPAANVTLSGINVKFILEKLILEKRKYGFVRGPAISDIEGKMYSAKDIDAMLHEVLGEIYESEPKLFPISITDVDSIPSSYQYFRTFRRSSNTRATEMGVAGGKKPNLPMNQHYAQLELLVRPFLRYTQKM